VVGHRLRLSLLQDLAIKVQDFFAETIAAAI